LEASYNITITDQQYQEYMAHAVKYGRDLGLDKTMDDYNVNVIMGPADCSLFNFAACAGK